MDLSNEMPILFFLLTCARCVSGARLPAPDNLKVIILEEDVTVHWDKPSTTPSNVYYNVQFARYVDHGKWKGVTKCTRINNTWCHLTDLIEDPRTVYKVRVQIEADDAHSEWRHKKIEQTLGELLPPSFTMWATSRSLTVKVHKKPFLRERYLFGSTYTIYLQESSQNQTTVATLGDETWEHQNQRTFTSLHWGKEYCITVKVEVNGGPFSGLSPQQCLVLPEQEWIITAVASMTVSVFLITIALIAAFILCYIKRPAKTPPALKSPASGWRPLSVGQGPVEVVTDKGWFLFKAEPEVNHGFKNHPTPFITNEQNSEEDRRPSTDSGVSIKSSSDPTRLEDSGCGSIGTQHSVCNFPISYEGSDTLSTVKTDDSGMGLSCHSDASSLNLDEQDSGCLNKSGEYHSQKLLTVCVHESDNEEKLTEPQLVSVMSGYRTNAPLCTCSGANACAWCHNQSNYREKHKGLLQNNNIIETYSSYRSNNQMDNNQTETDLTFTQMERTFPMLTSLSSFPLLEKGRDFNMNDMSISLCDVELNSY